MKKIVFFLMILLVLSSCGKIKKQDCMRFTRDIAGKCIRTKTATQMNMGLSAFEQKSPASISIAEHIEDPSLHLIW
ncbi:MAG: hypothetical protein FGM61_09065 [Sediminibacterium sp.]|nr:hypothetical protein [Sediminibacterium sp.]